MIKDIIMRFGGASGGGAQGSGGGRILDSESQCVVAICALPRNRRQRQLTLLGRADNRPSDSNHEAVAMAIDPDFDFQIGKNVRLRGWNLKGLVALGLLLGIAIFAGWNSGSRLEAGFQSVVSHLIFATEKAR
jgi:hypothetical protein